MARVRSIMRSVACVLNARCDRIAHAAEQSAIFGGDANPDTTVPAEGWALLRWAYRVQSTRGADIIRACDSTYEYVERAASALSRLSATDAARIDVRTMRDRIHQWVRDNKDNPYGGEPYERTMRDELRTERYSPMPKRKGVKVSAPQSIRRHADTDRGNL